MPELLLHQKKKNKQNRTKWIRTKHSAPIWHPPLPRLVFCSSSPFKFRSQVWIYWLPWWMYGCCYLPFSQWLLSFFFFPDIHLALSLSSKWRGVTLHPSLTSLKEAMPQLPKPGIWSAPQDGTLEWLRLLAWDSPSTQFSVGRRPENLETESENLEPEKVF